MSLPPCRLFLVTPESGDSARLGRCLEAAAEAGDVACLLISAGEAQEELARMLTPIAQARDIAVVVDGDAALARATGADGVQVRASSSDYHEARKALGGEAIVGSDCGTSRHAAMELAEAGADYVGFSGVAGMAEREHPVVWWAEVFEVPVVVLDPVEAGEAAALVAAHADFIRPDDGMWQSPEAARETVAALMQVIAGQGGA